MSERRPEGEVFATLVTEVDELETDEGPVYQVFGEPALCPEYSDYYSQWGYVYSDIPIENGDIIILRTARESDSFTRILNEQEEKVGRS